MPVNFINILLILSKFLICLFIVEFVYFYPVGLLVTCQFVSFALWHPRGKVSAILCLVLGLLFCTDSLISDYDYLTWSLAFTCFPTQPWHEWKEHNSDPIAKKCFDQFERFHFWYCANWPWPWADVLVMTLTSDPNANTSLYIFYEFSCGTLL